MDFKGSQEIKRYVDGIYLAKGTKKTFRAGLPSDCPVFSSTALAFTKSSPAIRKKGEEKKKGDSEPA